MPWQALGLNEWHANVLCLLLHTYLPVDSLVPPGSLLDHPNAYLSANPDARVAVHLQCSMSWD